MASSRNDSSTQDSIITTVGHNRISDPQDNEIKQVNNGMNLLKLMQSRTVFYISKSSEPDTEERIIRNAADEIDAFCDDMVLDDLSKLLVGTVEESNLLFSQKRANRKKNRQQNVNLFEQKQLNKDMFPCTSSLFESITNEYDMFLTSLNETEQGAHSKNTLRTLNDQMENINNKKIKSLSSVKKEGKDLQKYKEIQKSLLCGVELTWEDEEDLELIFGNTLVNNKS